MNVGWQSLHETQEKQTAELQQTIINLQHQLAQSQHPSSTVPSASTGRSTISTEINVVHQTDISAVNDVDVVNVLRRKCIPLETIKTEVKLNFISLLMH